MIKKEHRLKKNRQFNYIYKNGNANHSKFLSLISIKTKYQPYKVGFTVSKKIGKSVVRSKVKRRLRESFNLLYKNIKPTHNLIFLSREGIDTLSFLEIQNCMKNLLIKANLYNE